MAHSRYRAALACALIAVSAPAWSAERADLLPVAQLLYGTSTLHDALRAEAWLRQVAAAGNVVAQHLVDRADRARDARRMTQASGNEPYVPGPYGC